MTPAKTLALCVSSLSFLLQYVYSNRHPGLAMSSATLASLANSCDIRALSSIFEPPQQSQRIRNLNWASTQASSSIILSISCLDVCMENNVFLKLKEESNLFKKKKYAV